MGKKRRSAIVPAVVFAAGLSVAAGVIPNIVGCSDDSDLGTTGVGLDVAYLGFDMSGKDLSALTVANLGFDMGSRD